MKDVHGALVLDYISQDPVNAPRRYVQNHVFDGWYGTGELGSSPLALNRDFMTEVWFSDPATAKASRETPFYLERLRDDEADMVDNKTVIGMPIREKLVSTSPSVTACQTKVFALLPWAAEVTSGSFEAAWGVALSKAPLKAARQHVCNQPVAKTPIDWIDSFWLPDESAAYEFAENYAREVLGPLEEAGVVVRGGGNILLAREYVLYAGDTHYDIKNKEERT
jgi:hypothetical protein